jgi:hypothetical protein
MPARESHPVQRFPLKTGLIEVLKLLNIRYEYGQSGRQMRSRPEPLFKQQLWQANTLLVAGVDEVGVGAGAGPVVAAAVVLPRELSLTGLNDSKLLSAKRRAALFDAIRQYALAIGIGRGRWRRSTGSTSTGRRCWRASARSRR